MTLVNEATGLPDYHGSGPTKQANASLFLRTKFTAFRRTFRSPQMMIVTLMAINLNRDSPVPLVSVALELSRKQFPCPTPQTEQSGNSKPLPTC